MPSPEGAPPSVVQLPAKLANQIAAGEVVARPASVVKEFCENAIDAHTRHIRVEVEGGGIDLIRVIDNGHGMSEEDARLAMQRHATSKLRVEADLRSIRSLGFRGEALPSIASVGRFLLRTRLASEPAGVELRCDGGEAPDIRPCGCAPGTTVELADLFFNVPARRKFLRAVSTESAHITEVVREVALAHPTVGVELIRDGRRAKRWLAAPTREDRAKGILEGYDLIACIGERGPVQIEAYLSRPERARSGATGLSIFVCGRPVRDRALARAIATAYGEALDRGRFPTGVLFLELPGELVDVNVHPQKAEVRFAHARAVTDAVYGVVSSSVAAALALPLARKTQPHAPVFRSPEASHENWTWSAPAPGATRATASGGSTAVPVAGAKFVTTTAVADADVERMATKGARRFLGAVHGYFMVFDGGDGLLIVDGRKARAARLVLALDAELDRGRIVAQRLLFPVSQACEGASADAVEQASDALERLGFELRRTGPGHVALHTLPRLLADGPAATLLEEVLATLENASSAPFGIDGAALLRRLAEHTANTGAPPSPHDLDAATIVACTVRRLGYDDLTTA